MTLHITLNVQKTIAIKTQGKNVGETGCRLSKRVIDHNVWDKNSHIFKHLVEMKQGPLACKSLVSWYVIIVTRDFAEKLPSHYL